MNTTIYLCSERQHFKVSMRYSEMSWWIILPCSYSTCLQVTQLSFSEMSEMFRVNSNRLQPNHKCQVRGEVTFASSADSHFESDDSLKSFCWFFFFFLFLILNFPTTVFVISLQLFLLSSDFYSKKNWRRVWKLQQQSTDTYVCQVFLCPVSW